MRAKLKKIAVVITILLRLDTCEDNQAVLIIPKKRKNITLRLKKNKEQIPSDIDSTRKESLIIALGSINKGHEVKLAHSDNISDIDIPGGKLAKLQKLSKVHRVPIADADEETEKGENEINILENRSMSDENNSGSCKGADINAGKNINEKSIGVPESNNELIVPISRKNVSLSTFTSLINNDTNDDIESKKLQPEMGRGKRRRTKKIFQDFCTDDNSEKGVLDDAQENSQNRKTKNDALDGNNSNAESQKISGADRKRKSGKNNQEEELKSKENICRPYLKKKCTRLLDRSSSIVAEQGNSVDINLKETSLELRNKKEKNANSAKYDQNEIGESDSTETSENIPTSHIECVNLEILDSSTCLERWNSPLNTTKMRTYSKKKSLITVAGEQSNSSSFQLNESNKNITTEDRAIVKDSSFLTGYIGEEVKNRSISESKELFLPVIVSSKRNLSKKTNAPKTKALMETDGNSNLSSNDNVLKREHEEDNTKLSRDKKSKSKKIDNALIDKKKSTVSPSKPKATEKRDIKQHIHSEHVQISVKNTTLKDKEISSITSRNQRKTKHSKEAKKDDEPLNEDENNFPKSSTPIKSGGRSSMAAIDQKIEAEESFAASFSSNKSDESSPARRSGRKRKLNCRLQPFFGPCENVMFTGYSDPKALAIINKLGGQVVDCPKSCTVLVTDKVRRTVKFLCALALGRPIVSPQWLASSKMSLTFLDHDKYLLRDKEAEKQFSFTLKESLAKARKTPLLQGKSVFVTNCVKPPPVDMKSIVECSGGTFLTKAPTNWPQNSVIISCNEDKSVCNKIRKKQSNLPIVSAEFILSGILQQDFNPDKYML
uniref:PAX-interacting protein 1 n=1 Tax=Panstrongylus lignarius TaxID=156445 RepID=A0A224XJJ8_9HEMI